MAAVLKPKLSSLLKARGRLLHLLKLALSTPASANRVFIYRKYLDLEAERVRREERDGR